MPYKDLEKRRECQKRYRDSHKEYYKQKKEEYEQRYPERKKVRRKRYYEEHKIQENLQNAAYRLNQHREYKRVFNAYNGKWECEKCGATRDRGAVLCIHHINLNHNDNTPSNLMCLCLQCHSSLHGKIRAAERVTSSE